MPTGPIDPLKHPEAYENERHQHFEKLLAKYQDEFWENACGDELLGKLQKALPEAFYTIAAAVTEAHFNEIAEREANKELEES